MNAYIAAVSGRVQLHVRRAQEALILLMGNENEQSNVQSNEESNEQSPSHMS